MSPDVEPVMDTDVPYSVGLSRKLENVPGRMLARDEEPVQLLARERAYFANMDVGKAAVNALVGSEKVKAAVRVKDDRNTARAAVRTVEEMGLVVPDDLYIRAWYPPSRWVNRDGCGDLPTSRWSTPDPDPPRYPGSVVLVSSESSGEPHSPARSVVNWSDDDDMDADDNAAITTDESEAFEPALFRQKLRPRKAAGRVKVRAVPPGSGVPSPPGSQGTGVVDFATAPCLRCTKRIAKDPEHQCVRDDHFRNCEYCRRQKAYCYRVSTVLFKPGY